MRAAGEVMRQRIVRGIQELTTRNNRPPTNRELGEYLGGKSTGHIDYHLRILREQGVLLHDPKKSRGIMLLAPEGRSEAASAPAGGSTQTKKGMSTCTRRRRAWMRRKLDTGWVSTLRASEYRARAASAAFP